MLEQAAVDPLPYRDIDPTRVPSLVEMLELRMAIGGDPCTMPEEYAKPLIDEHQAM